MEGSAQGPPPEKIPAPFKLSLYIAIKFDDKKAPLEKPDIVKDDALRGKSNFSY